MFDLPGHFLAVFPAVVPVLTRAVFQEPGSRRTVLKWKPWPPPEQQTAIPTGIRRPDSWGDLRGLGSETLVRRLPNLSPPERLKGGQQLLKEHLGADFWRELLGRWRSGSPLLHRERLGVPVSSLKLAGAFPIEPPGALERQTLTLWPKGKGITGSGGVFGKYLIC